MISTLQDFEEGTAFELYVLERVRPAIEQHGGASIDLRGSKTVAAVAVSVSESLSGPR
jgi:Fe-S cluster biogenesis protein NfuA